MTLIHIEARWNPGARKFEVELEFNNNRYVERLSRSKWNRLIVAVKNGKRFKIGGMRLKMTGLKAKETEYGIRQYLLAVDDAFTHTGSTDKLRGWE